MDKHQISLAQFISETREKHGLSQSGPVKKTAWTEQQIADIESGKTLFLSTTERQKIANALKISASTIKRYEKTYREHCEADTLSVAEIKRHIEKGETANLKCPVCGTKLTVKIINRFDIEDNPVTDYKAVCPKCPFQIK